MTRYFIITKDAELFDAYYAYKVRTALNDRIIAAFIHKNIDKTLTNCYYVIADDVFGIAMSDKVHAKFAKQVLKTPVEYVDGVPVYVFKRRSSIGSKYAKLHVVPVYKPKINMLLPKSCRVVNETLFEFADTLYATVTSENKLSTVEVPYGWHEINKQEYCKMLVVRATAEVS